MTGGGWDIGASLRTIGVFGVTGQLKAPRVTSAKGVRQTLSYGTGSGQVNLIVAQTVTIAAATVATYDLYTGTDLKDINNVAAPFRGIKGLMIWIDSGGDASGVAIGAAAAQAWPGFFADASDKQKIFPSGPPYLAGSPAGVVVGATTNNLKIENLGAAQVVVGIALAGTNA